MEKTMKICFSAVSIAVFIRILFDYSTKLLEFGNFMVVIVTAILFVMANKSFWGIQLGLR